MVSDSANQIAFLKRLLTHPGERQDVDYKSSHPFAGDNSFSLKLIRHIQGMTNSGGGWLVVGFAETPTGIVPDSNHAETICPSYDPTLLTQRVNSTVGHGQQVRLTVHYEVQANTGLKYPIIQVDGLERLPVVCRIDKTAADTNVQILRQGATYIRRPGAETVAVSSPQDWEDLITRCVLNRRQEFFEEFRDMVERLTSPPSSPPQAVGELNAWIDEMRGRRSNA